MHHLRPMDPSSEPFLIARAHGNALNRRVNTGGFRLREALTAAVERVLVHVGDQTCPPHLVPPDQADIYPADALIAIPLHDVFLFQAEPERYLSQLAGIPDRTARDADHDASPRPQ